jgi:LmbE family N-acetylglucosaminyl deacetylase
MNPYQQFVSEYVRLAEVGKSFPFGGFAPEPAPMPAANAPKALIFSPHPDDECITGALALRLLREARMKIVNVAVTQGSSQSRQLERFHELENACRFLGFDLLQTAPNGLEKISTQTRESNSEKWNESVQVIAKILAQQQPRVIFFPHERDWNGTHIGTHFLVMDALKTLPEFECFAVETEFWGAMETPNLMVESSPADVADLVAAISFHAGEVRRNPFHLRQPAWMQDNVRRGSELIGGEGSAAPDFKFATLYRLRKWRRGKLEKVFEGGRPLSCQSDPGELFA